MGTSVGKGVQAAIAIAMAWAVPAAAGVAEGNAAWLAGNYAKAIAEWRPAADRGSPEAQFNLGQAYKMGNGVTANPKEAEAWYRKSAAQGFVDAEDALGLMLFRAGQRQEAMPFIAKSASRGEARSMYVLGTAKFNGDFAEKDWPGAYALMTRAAAAGVQPAKASLEQMDRFLSPEEKALANRQLASAGPATAPAAGTLPPVQPSYTPGVTPAAAPPVQMAAAALPTYTSPPPGAAANAAIDSGPTAEVDGQIVAVPGAEVNVPGDDAAPAARPLPAPITRTPLPASTPPAPAARAPVPTPRTSLPASATPAPTMQRPPVPTTADRPAPAAAAQPERRETPPPAAATRPAVTAPAPAPRPANGRWKVQLGAFGTPAAAQAAWNDISRRTPALRGWRFATERAGAITRLQAAGLPGKAEAERLCRAVTATGAGCFPVAP